MISAEHSEPGAWRCVTGLSVVARNQLCPQVTRLNSALETDHM